MASRRDELRDLGEQLSRQAMRQVGRQMRQVNRHMREVDRHVRHAVGGSTWLGLPDGMAEEVRRRIDSWRDPRAKLLRRRRRSVRAASTLGGVTVVSGTGAGVLEAAVAHPGASVPVLIGVAVVSGLAALRSGVRAIRLHRTPLPEPAVTPPPLPPTHSAARQPMERLAESEAVLAELLTQLAPAGRPSAVPADSVAQARATGAEAAAALRAVAAQLQAVERARDSAPPLHRGPLVEGVQGLRAQLDEGLDGYGALIAAAGQAVAASATSVTGSKQALTEATDHLAGLASALRELSTGLAG